jgi:hypothetical protein
MATDGDEGEWVSQGSFNRNDQALEDLGISITFLLEAASREADAIAERQEAKELGIPLAEFLDKSPGTDPAIEAAKQKLLGEIRRQALSLPPRRRNWICGYLRSSFLELKGCFTVEIDPKDDAAWEEKLEEIIKVSLSEPIWPILLGRLYGAVVQMTQVTGDP